MDFSDIATFTEDLFLTEVSTQSYIKQLHKFNLEDMENGILSNLEALTVHVSKDGVQGEVKVLEAGTIQNSAISAVITTKVDVSTDHALFWARASELKVGMVQPCESPPEGAIEPVIYCSLKKSTCVVSTDWKGYQLYPMEPRRNSQTACIVAMSTNGK